MQPVLVTPVIIACLAGWIFGVYEGSGLLFLGLLYLSAYTASKGTRLTLRLISHFIFVLLAVGLASHSLPGFNNIELVGSARTSVNAIPMALYLNFDKIHVGLAIMLYLYKPGIRQRFGFWSVPAIVAALAVVQLLTVPFGLMRFDFTLPDWLFLWLLLNIFTCFTEEAFFRGYIQLALQQKFGAIRGLVASSVLFGVAHFAGGPLFMFFAAIAGLGYGLAFTITGRLRYAVITHLVFNLLHLIFYSYPLPV